MTSGKTDGLGHRGGGVARESRGVAREGPGRSWAVVAGSGSEPRPSGRAPGVRLPPGGFGLPAGRRRPTDGRAVLSVPAWLARPSRRPLRRRLPSSSGTWPRSCGRWRTAFGVSEGRDATRREAAGALRLWGGPEGRERGREGAPAGRSGGSLQPHPASPLASRSRSFRLCSLSAPAPPSSAEGEDREPGPDSARETFWRRLRECPGRVSFPACVPPRPRALPGRRDGLRVSSGLLGWAGPGPERRLSSCCCGRRVAARRPFPERTETETAPAEEDAADPPTHSRVRAQTPSRARGEGLRAPTGRPPRPSRLLCRPQVRRPPRCRGKPRAWPQPSLGPRRLPRRWARLAFHRLWHARSVALFSSLNGIMRRHFGIALGMTRREPF